MQGYGPKAQYCPELPKAAKCYLRLPKAANCCLRLPSAIEYKTLKLSAAQKRWDASEW